jgi:anaerobic C4-dicarboxylate transporter
VGIYFSESGNGGIEMVFVAIGVIGLLILAIYFGYKIGRLPETILYIVVGIIFAIALPVIAHEFFPDHPLVLMMDGLVVR